MKIACTMAEGRGDTDLLLFRFSQRLQRAGLRPCGTVQINTENNTARRCDMDVRILPEGPVIRISQNLGRGSRGCRLNSDALERAVVLVGHSLDRGADILIVNKFGKHEAEGRGFRSVIAEALGRDIPVLVGLNALNRDAFEDFTGGLAGFVPPAVETLEDWFFSRCSQQAQA